MSESLGIITSDFRPRRRVHRLSRFPQLEHQRRSSFGYTYMPPDPATERRKAEAEAAMKALSQTVMPDREAEELGKQFGLIKGKRPYLMLIFLHRATEGPVTLLPSVDRLAVAIGIHSYARERWEGELADIFRQLVARKAIRMYAGQGRTWPKRAIKLHTGRILRTPDAPVDWGLE